MSRKIYTWVVLAVLVVSFVGVLGLEVARGASLPGDLELGPFTLRDLLFYMFAGLTVVGACATAFSKNIVYSAIGLLAALAGAGAISADFLAVAQLLVYIGGVLVLILFAVMLTNRITEVTVSNVSLGLPGGVALLIATAPVLAFVALATPWPTRTPDPLAPTTRAIGNAFLTQWLLPFELASLVLLATLIGAVIIARKDLKADEPDPSLR